MQALDVISLSGRWYALVGDQLQAQPAYPDLDGPLRLLTDFDAALFDSERLAARPAHAAALIERRLRDEGMVSGQAHMLLHRTRRVGGGCQALYTAIETPTWQRYCDWQNRRGAATECFALGGVMSSLLAKHDAVVVLADRQIHWLARGESGPEVLRVAGYSASVEDMLAALDTLIERAADQLQGRANILWCDLLAAPLLADAVRERFAEHVDKVIERAPAEAYTGPGSESLRSCAGWLLQHSRLQSTCGPIAERLHGASVRLLPMASAAVFVLALLAAGMGWNWQQQYRDIAGQPQQLHQQSERLLDQVRELGPRADRQPGNQASLAFLERSIDVAGTPDLVDWLRLVREAADGRVAIYRLQLSDDERGLRVEGLSRPDAGGVDQLSGFIAALRLAGYTVTPAESASGSLPAGYFAFHLQRVST